METPAPRRWQIAVIFLWCLGWLVWAGFDLPWKDLAKNLVRDGLALTKLSFAPSFFPLTATRLFHLSACILLLASAVVIGHFALRLLRLETDADKSRTLTALAVGLLVLGNAVLGLGLLGLLKARIFWSLVLIPLGAWIVTCRRQNCREKVSRLQETMRRFIAEIGFFGCFFLALATVAATINLLAAFLPPNDWDTLNYHLAVPKEYMQQGRIVFLPHNFSSNFPSLLNMLFLWGLVVGSGGNVERLLGGADGIPHLLNWSLGILSACALFQLARSRGGIRTGAYAAGVYYLSPNFLWFSSSALVDIGVCFFSIIALDACWRAIESQNERLLLLGAIVGGAAVATKFTALFVVVLPLALSLAFHEASRPRRTVRWCCLFLVLSLAVGLPWLIRNWAWTGNPVFPFLSQWFPSPYWDDTMQKAYFRQHGPAWRMGDIYHLGGWLKFTPGAAGLVVWLAPLCFLSVSLLLRYSFAFFEASAAALFWLGTMNMTERYIFPIFPALCLAGVAVIGLAEQYCLTRWTARAAVVVLALTSFLQDHVHFLTQSSGASFFTGQSSRADFLRQRFPAQQWMNEQLPVRARVLYVGEYRSYYSRAGVIYRTAYGERVLMKLGGNPKTRADWVSAMRKAGVTHIYVNWTQLHFQKEFYGEIEKVNYELFRDFLHHHARLIHPCIEVGEDARQQGEEIYELMWP